MALYAGFGGSAVIAEEGDIETPIANIGEWELEIENEVLEAEMMNETFIRKEYGLGNATGSITVYYDKDNAQGQGALTDAALNKTKVQLRLKLPGDMHYWEGAFLIGSLTNSVAANDLVQKEYSIEADGPITLVTDSPEV
jgi:hypothetical protein